MSDLDRYLTDDMIHVALRASDSANEGGVVGGRERMMRAALSAVLPVIIRQAQIEALEFLLGQLPEPARPYAGSPFFWEGYMKAVKEEAWEEALQARARWIQDQRYYAEDEVPNPYRSDHIRQAKAEAWDEGHRMSDLNWRHIYDGHPCDEGEMCPSCCQPNPYERKDRR